MNRHGWLSYVTGGNVIRDGLLFKPDKDVVIRDSGRPDKYDFSHHWPLICDGIPRRHIWAVPC
jgi:hypothetical protein